MEIIIDAEYIGPNGHKSGVVSMYNGYSFERYRGEGYLLGMPSLVKEIRYALFKIRPQFP